MMLNTAFEYEAVNPALCHLCDSDTIVSLVVSPDGSNITLLDKVIDPTEVNKELSEAIATYYPNGGYEIQIEAYSNEVVVRLMDADIFS